MSKEIIRKEIDLTMETIVEQWGIIRAYQSKVPLIEMDIFRRNIRKLYEDFYILDKMNKAPGFDPKKIKSQITRKPSITLNTGFKPKPKEQVSEIKKKVNELIKESPPAAEPEPEIFMPEQHQPVIEAEPIRREQQTQIESEPARESISEIEREKEPPPPPAPDLFGSQIPTLAEKLRTEKKSVKDQLTLEPNDNSLNKKIQQGQISDLKTAIGINDKFLFINELFKGDLAGYNRAIENLNACQSRQEALAKLDEMRSQLNWSDHFASYSRLNDFLKRRYND